MRQLVLDLLPESSPRLDNFVAGSNGEALTGLAAWLAADCRETSLLLWGEAGAGKTHLLRAVDAQYHDAALDADLADTIDAVEAVDVVDSAATRRLFAVENVEALSEAGQIALFNLFNRLRATGGRLLTSAGAPPRQLKLREDLRTRLGWGHVFELQVLPETEMRAVLRRAADARGVFLSDEVMNFVLGRFSRDLGSLMQLLDHLDRYALETQRAITIPLIKSMLHNE